MPRKNKKTKLRNFPVKSKNFIKCNMNEWKKEFLKQYYMKLSFENIQTKLALAPTKRYFHINKY
jgi:hypothetical protein